MSPVAGKRQPGCRLVTAVTATDPTAAWALVDGTDLVRVTPDGTEEVARLTDCRGLCIHMHRGTVFVGGKDARLWRSEGGHLVPVASFDEAPTRARWTKPWGDWALTRTPASVTESARHLTARAVTRRSDGLAGHTVDA